MLGGIDEGVPRYVKRESHEMTDASSGSRTYFLKRSTDSPPSEASNTPSSVPRLPPPPPPYVTSNPDYDSLVLKEDKPWMVFISTMNILFSVVGFAIGGICYTKEYKNCASHYSAAWTGVYLFSNGVFGLCVARKKTLNWIIGYLITTTVCFVASVVQLALSAIDWNDSSVQIGEQTCVIAQYDHERLRYIFQHMHKFDFRQCVGGMLSDVQQCKYAVTLTTALGFTAVIQCLLCLAAIVMSLCKVCSCYRIRFRFSSSNYALE